jgi:hypothetical protein
LRRLVVLLALPLALATGLLLTLSFSLPQVQEQEEGVHQVQQEVHGGQGRHRG